MFVYKHTETIQYVKQIQTSQVDNSRILRIKNAKFLEYCFYVTLNI